MTREEAIARVKHQRDWANEVNRTLDVEAFDMATKALEREPRWIPVTERLPEEGTFVLASYNSDEGPDVVMTYHNKYGFTRGLMTAWMPLPEPYEEDKE